MVTGTERLAIDGLSEPIQAITLKGGGLTARVLSWGATLQSLTPNWQRRSVIVGSSDPAAYLSDLLYFGAIVGPVANRIANGTVQLDGRRYRLDRNEGGRTTLHGGRQGLGQRNWTIADLSAEAVTLAIAHPDGLCGFPGPLEIAATYRLPGDGALEVEIVGQSSRPALFNPAFHGYWNLDGGQDVLDHRLRVDADCYTPVDADLIPLGQARPVDGTKFDYRVLRKIAPDIDHNLCTGVSRGPLRPVATLEGRRTVLDILTTEPGLQVYAAANSPSGKWRGLDGIPFGPHAGIALEPQLWPDAPNNPAFPSTRIAAGETVRQVSRFRLRQRQD